MIPGFTSHFVTTASAVSSPTIPFGRVGELALLLVVVVRRVVRRDEVDRAIANGFAASASTSSAVRSGGFIFAFVL